MLRHGLGGEERANGGVPCDFLLADLEGTGTIYIAVSALFWSERSLVGGSVGVGGC